LSEEQALDFGLTRKSKYEELKRQNEELRAYMNVLTGRIEALQKEVAELGRGMEASERKIRQLGRETGKLRLQKEKLEDSVEVLTKEREIFQKTIQNLWQMTRKQKQSSPGKVAKFA
jgi:predicted nuclease with TOPRIM domain